MDDLEITRRCAEAMGWAVEPFEVGGPRHARVREGNDIIYGIGEGWIVSRYDPLHDDAQCMALIKRFGLTVQKDGDNWLVDGYGYKAQGHSPDLNRAVCTAVAQMEVERG